MDPDGELWTIDHVIPWSRGGLTCIDNGVLSCRRCNCDKGAMTPAEYMRSLRFAGIVPKDDIDEEWESVPLQIVDLALPVSLEITEELAGMYAGGSWAEFCQGLFGIYPNMTQAQLRRAMVSAEGTGKGPEQFKGVAFEMYHRYSPRGDRSKFA